MAQKNIVEQFNEAKEKLRPEYKENEEHLLHDDTFSYLLHDADKKTTMEVIDGIAKDKFATNQNNRWMEVFATLPYIIRDNINDKEIVSASFKAMETMLNTATDYIKSDNKEKAVYEVNTIQDAMLSAIADLRDRYPNKLGEYTDGIYEMYKNMMKEYSIHGLQNDARNERDISDYYHGYDPYKDVKEFETERRQVDSAWETKERLEAAKQRIYNKFTKKEIAEYEQSHAEQVKKEDAQYKRELSDFAENHTNRKRSEEHQKQIDEIKLKHSDKALSAAYENYKDVARKPQEGEKVKEDGSRREVPKRAVFLGRAEPKGHE